MDPVASFSATDDEGDAITWSLKEADDYKKFAISEDGGVLTFNVPARLRVRETKMARTTCTT